MNTLFQHLALILAVVGQLSLLIAVLAHHSRWRKIQKRQDVEHVLDLLFLQQWSGDRRDELLTWHRIRNTVMGDQSLNHIRRSYLVNLINKRIARCRATNTSFRTVSRLGARPVTINTED